MIWGKMKSCKLFSVAEKSGDVEKDGVERA